MVINIVGCDEESISAELTFRELWMVKNSSGNRKKNTSELAEENLNIQAIRTARLSRKDETKRAFIRSTWVVPRKFNLSSHSRGERFFYKYFRIN